MYAGSINISVRPPLLLLAGVETVILFSSLYVAGFVLYGGLEAAERAVGPLAPRAALVTAIALVSLIAMGLYQLHQRLYFRETVLRLVVGLVAGALIVALLLLLFPPLAIDRKMAAIGFGYSFTLLLGVRYYFTHTVDDNVFRRRTLIYGAGERAASLLDLRRRADRRGFQIVGRMAAPGDAVLGETGEVMITNGKSILELAHEVQADEIVIAMDERRGNLPVRDLLDARLHGIDVIDLMEFFERETGKIRVDLVNPGWLIFSSGFRISNFRRICKRIVDIIMSAILIFVLWPVVLLIAIAIKIEDGLRAPILYKQWRVGEGNEPFEVLKFRSMTEDAESDGKAVWATAGDKRITRVGQFLRSSRLDEFPQVFNVLRGEMSLVGPRPERPEFVSELQESIPYYAERHAVKPGITGWAQLRYSYGASEEDALEKLKYDLYYVKNQSLLLDIIIILQTVEVVLWGKGAR